MSSTTYFDPVAKLLTYGDCRKMPREQWANYVDELGFTDADVPELIRMAIDPAFNELDSDGLEVWAPVHAWRTLGQLKAEAEPLLTILDSDDDYVSEDLPTVFRQIGAPAIPSLVAYIAEPTHGEWGRVRAVDGLHKIAETHLEHRDEVIAAIVHQLEQYKDNNDLLNTSLIDSLVTLKVVEAAPLIEEVFATGQVDEMLTGSWAHVQVELGLKQEQDFSPKELQPKLPPGLSNIRKMLDMMEATSRQPQGFGNPTAAGKKKKKKK